MRIILNQQKKVTEILQFTLSFVTSHCERSRTNELEDSDGVVDFRSGA